MQQNNWNSIRVTHLFIIELVKVAHSNKVTMKRFDLRVHGSHDGIPLR
jgi:hypothetical protein